MVDGKAVKHPECGGAVRFRKADIICSKCSWRPPSAVQDIYLLVPVSNRTAALGLMFMLVAAMGVIIVSGILWMAIVLIVLGLALLPVQLAVRSWAFNKMISERQ